MRARGAHDLPDLEHGETAMSDAAARRDEGEGGLRVHERGRYLHCPDGQTDRNQADRREPPRAVRLRAARALRGRHRARRHRGEVAARRPRHARARLRRRARQRGLARRRRDRRVRAGQHREPRPDPRPEAAPEARARSPTSSARCARRARRSCPTRLYFKDGRVKIEVALARGKEKGDKRRTIVDRDAKRQIDRALKYAGASGRKVVTSRRLAPLTRRADMRHVSLAVNGVRHELDLEPRELLVYVLRDRLGLTGTNVGCDTSSCGACTVLLNGESVKVLHAARRPGGRDGADHDRGARLERRPPPAAAGVPRAARAPVRLLHARDGDGGGEPARGEPGAERGRDPARARGQPLPLHRLPEHRRGRAARRPWEWRRDGHYRDPHHRPRRRHAGPAQGGPEARHRQRPVHRQHQPSRPGLARRRPQPVCARADRQGRPRRGAEAQGRRRRLQRRRARSRLGRLAALRLARHRRDQDAVALPARVRQGAARRRRRRGRRRGDAGDREGRGRARRGRVRAARGGRGRRQGARRRRTARARRLRDERVLRLEARRRRGRPGVRRGRRHGQAALPPAAADPRGDGAARRPRPGAAGHRRADAVDLDADPAHRAADARGRRRRSRRRGCA